MSSVGLLQLGRSLELLDNTIRRIGLLRPAIVAVLPVFRAARLRCRDDGGGPRGVVLAAAYEDARFPLLEMSLIDDGSRL
jgi:hypothetical protein